MHQLNVYSASFLYELPVSIPQKWTHIQQILFMCLTCRDRYDKYRYNHVYLISHVKSMFAIYDINTLLDLN